MNVVELEDHLVTEDDSPSVVMGVRLKPKGPRAEGKKRPRSS